MNSINNACPNCHKIFTSYRGVKIHMSKCQEFICELCDSSFREERYLKSHFKTKQHLINVSNKNVEEKKEVKEETKVEIKEEKQPQIIQYITNTTINNSYTNNGNQTIINNTLNYKPFTLEVAKDAFKGIGVEEKIIDESSLCDYTFNLGLSNYVFFVDQSRGKLGFYDIVDGKKIKIKDKGGILIADKVYEAVNPIFKEKVNYIRNLAEPDMNEANYVDILDERNDMRVLSHKILNKDPSSKEKFGKAVIKKISKYNANSYIEKFKLLTKFSGQILKLLSDNNFVSLFYEFQALGCLIKQNIRFNEMVSEKYIVIKDDKDNPTQINKVEFLNLLCFVLKSTIKENLSEMLDKCLLHDNIEMVKNLNKNQKIILGKIEDENELNTLADNLFFYLTIS